MDNNYRKDALIDKNGKYRYWLMRKWGVNNNMVNFILLNPSIADDNIDDPTVRSCVRIAINNNFDGLYVTNLFAFRSSKPTNLRKAVEPVGKDNNKYIKKYAKLCKKVIVAWGNHGSLNNRDKEVLNILNQITDIYCLGINITGHPKHPLFIPREIRPYKYKKIKIIPHSTTQT